jgi:nucleotide-binding universal stress UspA family protein
MKILIALDRSEYAEIVLEHGLEQAMQHPDSELHFITATADTHATDEAFIWLHRVVADGLDEFSVPGRPVVLHVRQGRPATVVSELASELHVDLLVVGRFGVPSESDVILDSVECPTLVVGIEGHALEPQCPDCQRVRRDTNAEQLFCERHRSDRLPDIAIHVPPTGNVSSRLW